MQIKFQSNIYKNFALFTIESYIKINGNHIFSIQLYNIHEKKTNKISFSYPQLRDDKHLSDNRIKFFKYLVENVNENSLPKIKRGIMLFRAGDLKEQILWKETYDKVYNNFTIKW